MTGPYGEGPSHASLAVRIPIVPRGGRKLTTSAFSQGCYSQRGDIIVLCAYLGQLLEIRKALSAEVTTVIDERDAGQLLDLDGNDELMADAVAARHVKVSNQV